MRLAPNRSELWQTLRLVLSCLLAWAIGAAFRLPETYWALITTVVVTKPLLPQTLDKGRDRVIGTVIGGLIAVVVLLLVQRGWPLFPLFCVAFLAVALVVAIVPDWRLAGVTLIVVVLIPGRGDDPLWGPLSRVAQIMIGSLAAAAVAFATRPRHVRAVFPSIAPEDDKEQDDRVVGR